MDNSQFDILIADDNPNNLKVISEMLKEMGLKIRIATDGQQVMDSLEKKAVDLILLDISMPKLDGYQVCEKLKADVTLKDIPVIFMSALTEEYNKVKGFKLGAVDYITKPIHMEEAKARISVHLGIYHQKKMLQVFNESLVKREMRIVELKREVNKLSVKLNLNIPYKSVKISQQ